MKYGTAIPIDRGASSEVLKAWDPDLQRHVAIKLLRRDDPESVERMLREARAQAKVEHPNVCDVYEVGEIDGRPYIAMRLIDGLPLDEAVVGLGLREKVRLLRTVAEAVTAAHRAGLVHRDLKPANILVERAEDGTLVPFVVDFGIAREYATSGLTTPGQVIGTPGYMSPEQVRGETATLDKRSDVFSLGALLYELAAGKHPFERNAKVDVLVAILRDAPPWLTDVAPDVPEELAVIAAKCLAKERDERYDSARELADDLGRWLDGTPVHAGAVRPQPPSWIGQLHRSKRGLAAVSLLVLAFVAYVVVAWWSAGRRTRTARELIRATEAVEVELRLARLSPAHDLAAQRHRAEDRVDALLQEIERLGRLARGPGELALGRALFALDRPQEAYERLQAAWDGGYRSPDVAFALGHVLVELYLREWGTIRCSANNGADEALAGAASRLLDPALAHLSAARASDGWPPDAATGFYADALAALAGGDLIVAVRAAREAVAAQPWLFEARLLEGRVHLLRAEDLRRNDIADGARAVLAAAATAFEAAAEIARSDSRPLVGLCTVAARRLEIGGRALEGDYVRGREACDAAVRLDPVDAAAWRQRSELAHLWAAQLESRGEDASDVLEDARKDARRAVAEDPDDAAGQRLLDRLGA